jgi:oligopeptide transport system ATP-binding protein
MSEANTVINVSQLSRHFTSARPLFSSEPAPVVRAVESVSFQVQRGECYAIVGESGSGKSSLARLLVGLLEPTSGSVTIDGVTLNALNKLQRRQLRRNVQLVLQDPRASLDPRMTLADILREALIVHQLHKGKVQQNARIATVVKQVGLSQSHLARFPHELSGGQRQRAAIARAIICEPQVLVLDEPVSALDVSVQAQILNLLQSLQRELQLTYVLITHDLGVVAHMASSVGVMYLGRFVEQGRVDEICRRPRHPYTQSLMSLMPDGDPLSLRDKPPLTLRGSIPSPLAVPAGCSFHTRCPRARELAEAKAVRGVVATPEGAVPRRCAEDLPAAVSEAQGLVTARCHYVEWPEVAQAATTGSEYPAIGASSHLRSDGSATVITVSMSKRKSYVQSEQ